jgi:hypothetical protein
MMIQDNDASSINLTARETCRICGSQHLAPLLDLGDQCISGLFATPGGEPPVTQALPLQLVRCDKTSDENACGLVQLRHSVPGSLLYRSYWYRSGINQTMTRNLHEIAGQASAIARPAPDDLLLDIGCNDGTLLDGYGKDFKLVGVDPSDVTRYAVAKGYDVINDFFSADALNGRYPDARAKIITSIAMFYDLEDPGAFVADIGLTLAEGGVWVMELAYLPTMLENNAFDTICHEHLEYYSFSVLERLLRDHGLEPVRIELNEVNGGSIRLFATHLGTIEVGPEDQREMDALREREGELALDRPEGYDAFAEGTQRVKRRVRELIQEINDRGETVHVYGASTKGNTILQFCDLDASLLPYAADRNPDKWGSRTIRTGIPIISEDDSRAMKPDYYLALPWHFLDEFLDREREFLERGGKFIVPLPDVRLVGADG